MKIQYYCYTRNVRLDYGDYLLPSNLSSQQLDFIRERVLSVISDNRINFSIPKWMLIKFDNVIIWGIFTWNSLLSDSYFKDHVGRSVYGFFSVVISEYKLEERKIPYDIGCFRKIYAERIAPYWNSYEIINNLTDDFIVEDFNPISASNNNYVDLLNIDIFQCKSLGELDKEGVIAAALTLDNVSLLIDNDNIEQATHEGGTFMNCLSSSVAFGSYPVKQLCPRCKDYVLSFTSAGVCSTCQENEQIRIDTPKKQEEDMNKQLKRDLDDANSKIQYLQYDMEEANKKIKKKDLLIKILLGVIVLLLTILYYLVFWG